MFRLMGVDLDGTIVDSAPDLSSCLSHVLRKARHEPPIEARTREWTGDGVEALIHRALHEAARLEPDSESVRSALALFDGCRRLDAGFNGCSGRRIRICVGILRLSRHRRWR